MIGDLMSVVSRVLEDEEINPLKEATVLVFKDGYVTIKHDEEEGLEIDIQIDARRVEVCESIGDIIRKNIH
ncbi:hypothetical protein CHCC5027_3542 [Bacillus paralicheniformis]|uniref:hypothetical protein n=1 Tax=Bacillus paralicheniformis TaxID=1648923 RepID=UPI00119EAFF3|nr:hypothetical protein [Bacillus paralicheniformis]TWJ39629.1 hypothetical protein CHCC5027_3542 [Bacillus paralicheniformis]